MSPLEILLTGLPVSSLRSATPLLFVLVGECLTQRSGHVNLGVEGQMLVGAMTGYAVTAASGSGWLGFAAGAAAGTLLSTVFAGLVLGARANAYASGLAVWMLGFGISAFAGSGLVGRRIEGFDTLPGGLTAGMVLAAALVPLAALGLFHTRIGLRWRAVGESVSASAAAGVTPFRYQLAGILVGGALSGLGGAALSVDYTRTWAEGMTAGRGLVAVGLVIVARWNPWLTLPAALLFGVAEALSLRLQAADSAISAHLLHTLPYLVSLLVFTVTCLQLRRNPRPSVDSLREASR